MTDTTEENVLPDLPSGRKPRNSKSLNKRYSMTKPLETDGQSPDRSIILPSLNENNPSAVPSNTSTSRRSSRSKQRFEPSLQCQDPAPPVINNVEAPPFVTPTDGNYRRQIILDFFHNMLYGIVDSRDIMKPPDNTLNSDDSLPQKPTEEERPSFEQSWVLSVTSEKSGSRYTVDSIREDKYLSILCIQADACLRLEMITFKSGNVYEGEVKEEIMHGEGKYTWVDGTVYQGIFEDGLPTGTGIMILQDRSLFEGQFRNGYFHGTGTYNLSDTPMFYKGKWRNGKMHGEGWLQNGDKGSYEGNWLKGLRQGKGFRKYPNAARYIGDWFENKKSGFGKMVYANNDYYSGTWEDDRPHGFGEYFWDIFFNETFTFPIFNVYKGTWEQGLRNGIGIMFLGMINGARLAGTWKNNFKHGPGLIICGNGVIIEKNPLFKYDKPAHKTSILKKTGTDAKSCGYHNRVHLFYDILNLINSKVPMREYPIDLVNGLNRRGAEAKYIRFADTTIPDSKMKSWRPLKISFDPPVNVDLSYFLDKMLEYCKIASVSERHSVENEEINVQFEAQDSIDKSVGNKYNEIRNREEQILRNTITIYLPKLTQLYNKYATIACDTPVIFKPAVVRLFLWQLYRDAQVMDYVSLVDIDEFLWNNPYSCYETKHYPFEPIYLWQFIQALIGCAFLCFVENFKNTEHEKGWIARIFTRFMENLIISTEVYSGQALTTHKNIVSFESMYQLYLTIGEPHSVRQFLASSYLKKGMEPPCYVSIQRRDEPKKLICGRNVVSVGNKLNYLKDGEMDVELKLTDKYSNTLYALRSIGRKKIISFFIKICPRIGASPSNADLSYKITFLEFLEIVLLCAFEKAEENKLKNESELKRQAVEKVMQASADKQSIYSGSTLPRISKVFRKRKKKSLNV